MKTSATLLTLFLLLAGCGSPESSGPVWTSDDHRATVYQSDGWATSIQEYTFDLSTRKLSGHWKDRVYGEQSAELSLSADLAAQLVELLGRVRLESTTQRGCATDTGALTLELVDTSGATRRYSTHPELTSCGSQGVFAEEEDVRAVLDACTALLPAPQP
jgi:hypothetical protein